MGKTSRYSLKCTLLSVCLLTLPLAATAVAASESDSAPVTVHGRVVDENHDAIPGAEIVVTSNDRKIAATVTDAAGVFSLRLSFGQYQISAIADGFTQITKNWYVTTASEPEEFEIILPVGGTSAVVTITDATAYGISALSSATRTFTDVRNIPQSVSVVSKEQIRDQSMASVADVVTYLPGVTSHQGENNRDQIVIRGNSTSADFFLNGVRDDVQYYRDLYNVERVELLKGPNSMTFGRGGGGGVINRVTRQAGFSRAGEVTAQGGSYGDKRFTVDFNEPFGTKLAARLNAVYENSRGFRRFAGLERYGVNPTLSFTPGSRTAVTLSYEYFSDRRVADRGIPSFSGRPVNTPIETYFGNPNDSRVRATVNLAALSIDQELGRFTLRNRTLFGRYNRFYQNYVPGAVTADQSRVALSAYNNSTWRRNLFNQTDLIVPVSTGRLKHNLLGGVEIGQQLTNNVRNTGFFNNNSTSISVALDNPLTELPVTFRPNATDANNHLQTNLAAVYAQDQVELSRWFQVIAGVRYDYFDLQFHNNRNRQDLRRIDPLVSPRFGLVTRPLTGLSLYGSYTVAYLPSSGDQFSSLTTITQQIKPEKFANYELGAKWDARPDFLVTLAVYRQNRTNTRATDPNDPTRIVQTGSQRTNGFEAGLNGNVTRRWYVSGGYSYQNAFITSATISARKGATVALVPHHIFSLWNNYKLHSRFAVGLGLVRRTDMFAAVDNAVVLPGYFRADAAVYFNLNEHWRAQVSMQNLLDRKYFLNADGNNNISPGSPRAARVSVVARF